MIIHLFIIPRRTLPRVAIIYNHSLMLIFIRVEGVGNKTVCNKSVCIETVYIKTVGIVVNLMVQEISGFGYHLFALNPDPCGVSIITVKQPFINQIVEFFQLFFFVDFFTFNKLPVENVNI